MEKKRENRAGRKRWLLIMDAVLLLALLFALWQLIATLVDYRRAQEKYDAIAEQAVRTALFGLVREASCPLLFLKNNCPDDMLIDNTIKFLRGSLKEA